MRRYCLTSFALVTLLFWLPLGEEQDASWKACWGSRTLASICCSPGAFPHLEYVLHLPGAQPCFDGSSRTYAWCCEGDDGTRNTSRVLIYSMPKTATRHLEELFTPLEGVSARKTHFAGRFESLMRTMRPPCTVIVSARNPFWRNPSQFFHFAVRPEGWQRYHQQFTSRNHAAAYMSAGLSLTKERLLNMSMRQLREKFRWASTLNMRSFQFSFLEEMGYMLAFDFQRFAREETARSSEPLEYLYADATQHNLKCSVLVLCFERVKGWGPILQRFFPGLSLASTTDAKEWSASSRWYADKYREFTAYLRYTPFEKGLMCQTDTVRLLPFYQGICGGCRPSISGNLLCARMEPGVSTRYPELE